MLEAVYLEATSTIPEATYFYSKIENSEGKEESVIIRLTDFELFNHKGWDPLFVLLQELKIFERYLNNYKISPHIVGIRDYFVSYSSSNPAANPRYYVIMDEHHSNLRDLLEIRRELGEPYTEEMILRIAQSLLSALSILHKLGIAHQNIRPETVMFNHNTKEFMLDGFGLAEPITKGSYAQTASLIGTPIYLPLSLLTEFTVKDGRIHFFTDLLKADMYSLGVLLIELFGLKLEVEAGIPSSTFYEIIKLKRLKTLEDFCQLCEQKYLLHNHLIGTLK